MNNYISFEMIKKRREHLKLTQQELASKISVSEKTISKWETKRGYPDISLLPLLASALGITVSELISGKNIINHNKAANMLKTCFYVCPLCGNVITSIGSINTSCCGIELIELDAEIGLNKVEIVSGEIFVTMDSPMTKTDFISFVCYITSGKIDFVKLYPEQEPFARFIQRGHGFIYYYDIKNGLFKTKI